MAAMVTLAAAHKAGGKGCGTRKSGRSALVPKEIDQRIDVPVTKPPSAPTALLSVPISNGNSIFDAQEFRDPSSVLAKNSGSMRFVHDQNGTKSLAQFA